MVLMIRSKYHLRRTVYHKHGTDEPFLDLSDMQVDQEPMPQGKEAKRISGNSCPLPFLFLINTTRLRMEHPQIHHTPEWRYKGKSLSEGCYHSSTHHRSVSLTLIQSTAENVHEHIRMGHPIREADDCPICMI